MSGTATPARPVPAARPGIFHAGDAEWFASIPGEQLAIRVHGWQVNGRFSMLESRAAPGCATPLHSHREEEVFHVLAGRPTFRLGEEIFEAASGSMVVIPAGTPHAWANRASSEVHMIAIFSPGGVEALFTQLAGLTPEEIAARAATYGTRLLGPPMPATAEAQP